ncbi:MAG: acyl carrier protein [Desulfobacterales bacterium]|nr:acyl carrier protein [Desulfobacterales bacterium]
MSDMFSEIEEGIQELFPETEDMDITRDMELGAIPDWDSMASVNLQGFLEQTFQVTVPHDLLSEETKISEVISYMEEELAVETA